MSSIKGLFEVYKAKPKDEQKFVDKHVTIKHKDENGNGDDVFQASNVKTVDRKKTKLGYDAGEDEKVYEKVDLDDDQIVEAIVEMAEIEGIDLTEEDINELVGQINPATTRFFKGSKRGSKAYLKGHPESPQNKKMLRLLTKTGGLLSNRTNEEAEVEEGFVSAAQRKAVWATREDGGKGHPDNKKKKNMKEAVERDDTTEKTEMAQTQLHFIGYAVKEILDFVKMGGEVEEWYQNKLSKVHSDVESLHSYIEGEKRRTGMVKENADIHPKLQELIDRHPEVDRALNTGLNFQHAQDAMDHVAGHVLHKMDYNDWSQYRQPLIDHFKSYGLKEEVEELDEVLTAKTPMKTYIKDFQKSDAPQFKGKSQEKRREMAIAAKLSAERGQQNEEVEQIDEGLMHDRYMRSHGKKARGTGGWAFTTKQYGSPKEKDMHFTSGSKSLSDAHKEAAAKLGTKNLYVMEEVEQIDELSIKTLEKYKNAARNDAYIAYHGDDDNRRLLKRTKGIKTATKKIRSNFVKGVDEAFEQIDEAINFTALDAVTKGHDGKSYSAMFDAHGSSIHNKIKAVRAERDNQPGKTSHATFLHDKMLKAYASWYKNKKDVKEESEVPFEGPYKKTGTVRKDEYGNVIQNVPRHLAKQAMKSLKKEDVINRAIVKYLPEEAKYTLEERLAIKLESIPESHHEAIINLFNSLEESNQKMMLSRLSEEVGAAEILNFIIANKDV